MTTAVRWPMIFVPSANYLQDLLRRETLKVNASPDEKKKKNEKKPRPLRRWAQIKHRFPGHLTGRTPALSPSERVAVNKELAAQLQESHSFGRTGPARVSYEPGNTTSAQNLEK